MKRYFGQDSPHELLRYAILVSVLFALLPWVPVRYFIRFLGDVNIFILLCSLAIAGYFILRFLRQFGFFIYRSKEVGSLKYLIAAPFLFFCLVLVVDNIWSFPPDINIPFPYSIFFYPIIAFIVEVIFHLIPLTIFLIILRYIFSVKVSSALLLIVFVIIGMMEAFYQALDASETNSFGLGVFVFIHLLGINMIQLWIFKKFDFISMYLFRLVYYLFWHILWGILRLHVLF